MPNKATKLDLIAEVSRSTGLTQSETKIAVEELLSVIMEELKNGNSIELRGFGTFFSKMRKARPARNPKTGEVVPLMKRFVPLFKYAGELKKRISSNPVR
ncbi:MAG: integration host factor subunit beta [Chitinispirillales bacterium]|jgi:DNA-binding protein HU-beta/integration host factor subunit beta|nr:integration host factor subunit beta [Chitinispirillales bacterium]